MKKIESVIIEDFWGDKTVTLEFNDNINFLIGVNGSGKTTIINLIAACLNADFMTLDKAQFSRIKVDFFPDQNKKSDKTYIEVIKKEKLDSPYPNIIFNVKLAGEVKPKTFRLNELEEELLFRYPHELRRQRIHMSGQLNRDINLTLQSFVNLTWLSIHRTSRNNNQEDKSFESSIDQKIRELSSDLIKYFGVLDKKYSIETEKFQKNVFLSLIEAESQTDYLKTDDLESEKEKDSLKQIFLLFKLQESEFSTQLDNHFKGFDEAKKELRQSHSIGLDKLSFLLGTRRIHSIVQEWASLNEKKNTINKPIITFIEELNKLYQRKELFINEKNELLVRTQSGKEFNLINLSSGEKQLLIILGESLLQENRSHIYI